MSTPSTTATADIVLNVGTRRLQIKVSVDAGPIGAGEILPIARQLAGAVVGAAIEDEAEAGRAISCKAGCGACCRQLVPVPTIEARRIAEMVEAMPEPRRTQVRQRFSDALRRLAEAGMLAKLHDRENWPLEGFDLIGLEYFRLGIPCPFLEDESCSIHPERPITCREYLVTSPAENCAAPTPENIATVRIPLKVWPAVAKLDPPAAPSRFLHWVPLTLALDWAASHEALPGRPGPEYVQEFFEKLVGRPVPGTPQTPFEKS